MAEEPAPGALQRSPRMNAATISDRMSMSAPRFPPDYPTPDEDPCGSGRWASRSRPPREYESALQRTTGLDSDLHIVEVTDGSCDVRADMHAYMCEGMRADACVKFYLDLCRSACASTHLRLIGTVPLPQPKRHTKPSHRAF